jgi:hypothetical protein
MSTCNDCGDKVDPLDLFPKSRCTDQWWNEAY